LTHRSRLPALISPLLVALLGAAAASADAAAVQQSLAAGSRAEADMTRDAGRKPAEVVAFLGIEPGMTVVDLIAASGYYTEVLSLSVGPTGRVYAQNTAFTLQFREGANDKAMTRRLAGKRLPNVERLDREMDALGLAPGSVDAAITALNFHDVYNGSGVDAAAGFLTAVKSFLRPGGVLGIVDHHGLAGHDNAKLHRIQEEFVVEAATQAGFVVEASGDMLRFPADDRTQGVFAPGVRGKTDRFVLRLRKPAS
jgi:predicted methyltransferase